MGFLELRRQCGVSHEVPWGSQGASCVAPGKSSIPFEFQVRTGDCSPGYAIKESPHLAMTWTSRGFNPAGAPRCVSHEVRWRAQGASRAAPGKSGLHARGDGERVIALESC